MIKHTFLIGLGIAALFIGLRIGGDLLKTVGTPPKTA